MQAKMQLPKDAVVRIPLSMTEVVSPPERPHSLFVSGIDELNSELMARHRIRAVLTAQTQEKVVFHKDAQVQVHKTIEMFDREDFNILQHFEEVNQFIETNLQQGNVLVHCVSGISRSVTLVMAYLLKVRSAKLLDVYKEIKAKRPIINPNTGFCKQLKEYELSLFPSRVVSAQPDKTAPESKPESKPEPTQTEPQQRASQAKNPEQTVGKEPQSTPIKELMSSKMSSSRYSKFNYSEQLRLSRPSRPSSVRVDEREIRREIGGVSFHPGAGHFTDLMNSYLRQRRK